MSAMSPGRALSIAAAWLVMGCVTDHDQLAWHPGAGGSVGSGGSVGAVDGAGPSGGGAAADARAEPSAEAEAGTAAPPGPPRLALLHGVTDSPWIGFCFAIVRGGVVSPPTGEIWPPGGIDYGRFASVTSVSGAELGKDDLLPYVVAARSRDVVAGLSCERILAGTTEPGTRVAVTSSAISDASTALDASLLDATTLVDASGPPLDASFPDGEGGGSPAPVDSGPPSIPPVRVRALPEVPAVAFSEAGSYLIVAGGCLGGPGVTDPSEKSVCGEHYAPGSPTLTEIVVHPSHGVAEGHVGLAFLGGTPAVRICDRVEIQPGADESPLILAKNVPTGGVRPAPPDATHAAADLGVPVPSAAIRIFADASTDPIYAKPWATTLAAGGVTGIENGKGYTLVLIGPYPGFSKQSFWNDPVVTIVPDDA